MAADRTCFDQVADLYARVRPGYPEEVLDELCERARLPEGGGVLEVGPGTGQLSVSLAARGYRLHAVELGYNLAKAAAAALAPYPDASVEAADFETWSLPASPVASRFPEGFDLAVCAQAFHWIDPSAAYPRFAEALAPRGRLALLWTLDRSQDTPLWKATSPVYARYQVGANQPTLQSRSVARGESLQTSKLFTDFATYSHAWERTVSASEWLDQVRTFSSTLALEQEDREDFLHDLEIVLKDYKTVTRRYETVIQLATRV